MSLLLFLLYIYRYTSHLCFSFKQFFHCFCFSNVNREFTVIVHSSNIWLVLNQVPNSEFRKQLLFSTFQTWKQLLLSTWQLIEIHKRLWHAEESSLHDLHDWCQLHAPLKTPPYLNCHQCRPVWGGRKRFTRSDDWHKACWQDQNKTDLMQRS